MQSNRIFIYVFCLFLSLAVQANPASIGRQAKSAIGAIDYYLKMKKDFPNRDHSRTLRKTQRDILQFNNMLVTGNGSATEANLRLDMEAAIDYYADECERSNRNATLCKAATTQLAKYKEKYQTDYKPKKPVYPEIDFEKYTYTFNDKTYDLKNLKYTTATPRVAASAESKPAVSAPVSSAASATVQTAAEKSEEYTCEWDTSLPPRKLLYAPGCSGSSKVCVGYVKCNKNGWKINRLATCGAKFCTNSTATECALQKTYGSKTSRAEAPDKTKAGSTTNTSGVN